MPKEWVENIYLICSQVTRENILNFFSETIISQNIIQNLKKYIIFY